MKKISLYRDSKIGFDGKLVGSSEEIEVLLQRETAPATGIALSLVPENSSDYAGIGAIIYLVHRAGFTSDTFSVDLQGVVDPLPSAG